MNNLESFILEQCHIVVWRMYILVLGNQIGIIFIVLSLIVYINKSMVNKCED